MDLHQARGKAEQVAEWRAKLPPEADTQPAETKAAEAQPASDAAEQAPPPQG